MRNTNLLCALCAALALALFVPASAQRLDPIQWEFQAEPAAAPPGGVVIGRLTAKMDAGWHLYSPTTPRGGPIPTTIELKETASVAGYEIFQQPPEKKFDPNFQIDTEMHGGEAVFLYRIRLAETAPSGSLDLTATVRYQACTDTQCLPPRRKTVQAALRIDAAAPAGGGEIPAGFVTAAAEPSSTPPPAEAAPAEAPPVSTAGGAQDQGVPAFLMVAFGFGLAAIFTPCVFPMIPITVSFFLRRDSGRKGESVMQALVFCLGIIVLFTLLGIAATALLGPFGVVQLGSNPWVNGFVALVFFVFALSMLGAFEITLPSGLLTRLDRASQRGGFLGTLIMGLTFSLTAFACVGPFVGTLLAASVQGGGLRPLLGMLAFATGLAAPFFLLAMFPAYLQRLPRAGGWMARVKVVLGFIILAAMLKYLSNVDQVLQLGLLRREVFLAAWVVLFGMAGFYLLGRLRLEGVDPEAPVGAGRLLVGGAFLVFALSLIPGMFGGRLGELDAYVPAGDRLAFAREGGAENSLAWMKNDYEGALERARQQDGLVFVNFTGYACTNCHWMKANMFTRPEVAAALADFVLVELYTDGADPASERNQALQEEKFATVAIPYYAILRPDGTVVAAFPGLTRDPAEFLAFLRRGDSPAN